MIFSHFRTALRNLQRNKVYSAINIFGLSAGIACCLLLSLYVFHELSYDKHHVEVENIYRINTLITSPDGQNRMRTCSPIIAQTMAEEVAGIEYAARVLGPPGADMALISYNGNNFYESDGLIADSTVFRVFTYEFVEGDMHTSLAEANSVVLSDILAGRLFGSSSALDKVLTINVGGTPNDFKVTGVFRDKDLSHIHANFFTSMNSNGWPEFLRSPEMMNEFSGNNFVPSYVRLAGGEAPTEVAKKMNVVLMKYAAEQLAISKRQKELELELVKDIYLKSDVGQNPRINYIYGVASIAVFILIIACINFMNLSTARAARRASEIGVRKVMGAFRFSLVRQIMTESLTFVAIAALIGVGLAWIFLPLFNDVTGKTIGFDEVGALWIIGALVVIVLITGLLAGSYPAFYISSFQPAQVLKGKLPSGGTTGWLRRSLVVFQFLIAIVLVSGTIVISRQLDFIRSMPLGFDSRAKVILPLRDDKAKLAFITLQQEMMREKGIKNATGTDFAPGSRVLYDGGMYARGAGMETAIMHRFNPVDTGYMNLLGIKLIAGRQFVPSDAPLTRTEQKIIINRTSAERFNFTPEAAVGQTFRNDYSGISRTYEVIGVMEDFHQTDLHEKIEPLAFSVSRNANYDYMILDVETAGMQETLVGAERIWNRIVSGTPFEFKFLDDSLQKLYDADQRTATLINSFSLIALVISCLGLYALSAFMAERRFKEIGIRKVLGASVSQVVVMMSSEYVKLVAVALLISVPLSIVAINRWLTTFAYRIDLDYTIFVYAGLFALAVALLTVGFETVKAAVTNPVKSLKSDG